ncbi:ABC transporter permease [Actinomarinicola tropica]|uniref:FtsX-like permease family protein n=1 Tax=Actinomarinicola tropica TaxID=2789776 RepID=A0A5Q2RHK3_9ACTN|nr:FtsX-like permease family protein [Actinomarinicola tropica]QGG95064.1 FtsX-like permease family protein [Actinomarinicola tropica]
MTLALREIRRAKLRFSLLAGAVGLLVFLILFQQTLLGTLLGYFTGALENQSGEVVVFNEEARRNLEGSILTEEQLAAIADVDGVEAAGPLGQGTFTVRAVGELTDASLFGYELGGPGEPTRLVEGRLPESDGEAVASSVDASAGFDIGDTVEVADGEVAIEVVGLAADSRFSVQPVLFVSYATWEGATQAVNPDAPAVLPSAGLAIVEGDAADVATAIGEAVDGVEALDRATAVDSLPGVAAVSQSFNLILVLAFVVVTLVVGFFFLILTVQKLPALSLLKALGYSDGALIRSVVAQVLVVSIAGVLIGGGMLQLASLASSQDFPIEADPRLVATSGGAVVLLALLASVGALRRVKKVAATDAVSRQSLGGLS